MGDEKRVLILDKYDHRLLVKTLCDKRNELIQNGEPTDLIDEMLLKAVDAPTKHLFKKKEKVKSHEAR